MFSLQKLFGRDGNFFTLLETSAEEARQSVKTLNRMLSAATDAPSIEEFHASKVADKKITEEISRALVTSFAAELEREDIEALSGALYRIPKTVEKFAERFIITRALARETDFTRHIVLLDAATDQVVKMVRLLRKLGSGRVDEVKEMNRTIQQIEGDADDLILEILGELYSGRHDAVKVVALRDLFELLEKIIDRCRDTGNVITQIVLKNS